MRSQGSSCACLRPSEMRLFSASTFRISTSTSSPFFTTSEGCCTRFVHDMSEMKRVQRSEEHTSELQSRQYLVCRLLLEKKKHRLECPNEAETTTLAIGPTAAQ